MKLTVKYCLWLLPLLLISILQNGCTYALWTNGNLDGYREPAENPHLHLYTATPGGDILVVYNEYSERKDTTRTRSYWLCRNQGRVEENHEPHFARKNAMNKLTEMPVFCSLPDKSKQGFYAVGETNQMFFTLYSKGQETDFYDLPVYKDRQGTVEKIALTPVAASADAVMVGGIAGFYILYSWAQSGGSFRVGK